MRLPAPHRPVPALVLLLMGAALGATIAAETVATPSTAVPAAAELLAGLPTVAELSRQGERVVWQGAGVTLAVVAATGGDLVVDSAVGRVVVPRRLIAERQVAAVAHLPELAEEARTAGLAGRALSFQDGMLTGPSLRSADVVVVAQGVLRKEAAPAADAAAGERVASAVEHLRACLEGTGLDAIGQHALDDLLDHLARRDGGQAIDEIAPSFARRVVRHGWLRQWFRDAAGTSAVGAVEQAVAAAERPLPVTVFVGDGHRLEEVADAFGRGGWVWYRGDRVLYARAEPAPEYIGRVPALMTVIELPAGADPAAGAAQALAARLFADQRVIAAWSAADGFHAEPARWRKAVPEIGGEVTADAIPPHLLITDLHGDVAGLAVQRGLLRPAVDDSKAAAERFLADAGSLLPDAAHLDLIGEYLFTYVYPSPDSKHPGLMGNKQAKGNVQQTVWQTCANVSGGLMHGDCADIAELYHTITAAQGHNPIVIGLPEHAACAWAEQQADLWHVHVLQTGPPLAFSDAQLPDCLRKAYKSFDPSMVFDPDQVPLLLRFSGEVSRSSWALSWRIFRDPAYCATMIEVQRAWHFQTYQRGITTMEKLIASGDRDNANYRELAGLASVTGQYDLAVSHHRQAMALTSDAESRLTMSVELVGHLLNARRSDEAAALASEILDRQLPALKDGLGDSLPHIGIDLALACLNQQGGPALRPLAVRALADVAGPQIDQTLTALTQFLAAANFNREVWDNSTEMRSQRTLVSDDVAAIVALIAEGKPADLPGDARLRALMATAQRWLDGLAFHDIEEDSAVMARYALAGDWYGAVLGEAEFDRRLSAAGKPADATIDHGQRLAGAAQMERDLPWIRASVPYWFGRLAMLFRRDRPTLDPAQVARLAASLDEARRTTAALGLSEPWGEDRALLGAGIAALVARDEAGLRQVLRRVAAAQTKELRDDAAQWLGDAARFLPPEWYARVLQAWVDEVDYKPKYFWIAWRAVLGDAPQQALMAAKLAAERFRDDPTFSEEYAFMRRLLASAPQGAAVPRPPAVSMPP